MCSCVRARARTGLDELDEREEAAPWGYWKRYSLIRYLWSGVKRAGKMALCGWDGTGCERGKWLREGGSIFSAVPYFHLASVSHHQACLSLLLSLPSPPPLSLGSFALCQSVSPCVSLSLCALSSRSSPPPHLEGCQGKRCTCKCPKCCHNSTTSCTPAFAIASNISQEFFLVQIFTTYTMHA